MRFTKIALTAVPIAAVAAFTLGGVAHATVNPNPGTYTPAGTESLAGYRADAIPGQGVNFTHITAYIGNDGNNGQNKLDAFDDNDNFNGTGIYLGTVGVSYRGLGGDVAAIVEVPNGVSSGPDANEVNVYATVNGEQIKELLANVPDNDTLSADILHDAHAAFHNDRGHFARGTIVFTVEDLSEGVGPIGRDERVTATDHESNDFTEGGAVAVLDTSSTTKLAYSNVALSEDFRTVPNPVSPSDLVTTFAHVSLNGNDSVTNTEEKGSIQSSPFWTAIPEVVTQQGGNAVPSIANPVSASPDKFFDDNFSILLGQPSVVLAG